VPTTDVASTRRTVVLAIDGNSLGHRAFHSTREDPERGLHTVTGAVVSMLATAWIHGPYDGVVVGFDHPVNHRKVDHPEYKANRVDTDPDLREGLITLRQDLAACGFTVVEEEGCEADDLLAAAVDDCLDRRWSCDVLSSDRDLTALVTDDVRLLRPKATFSDLVVEDLEEVRRAYGIEPHQYVDLAALRGDPSDGLDGVEGIGPRIAARLLRDHGSVTGIYDALIDLPPRIEAALRAARDRVERNLVLMAPIPHLEVDVGISAQRGIDLDRIDTTLSGLGLDRAARRFRGAVTAPPRPPMPPPPEDPDPLPVRRARPIAVAHDGEQASLF
jgi:5'-3' exonuclease